tara:strand:+ start:1138 stop:1419 length:282 start_codon:yes stop_codon:yes gene_type:complete
MKILAETLVSFFDLLEAEGRLLRKKALQSVIVVMLMSVACLFLAAALALLLAALYQVFIIWWAAPLAYLATAFSSLILAGVLSWISYHFSQKQ